MKWRPSLPALAISNYIYGEGDRAEELWLKITVIHPLFMQATTAGIKRVSACHSSRRRSPEITVKVRHFQDWESVTVKLAEGESNNTFRLTVSEGKPLASKFADMQIRPGDHCTHHAWRASSPSPATSRRARWPIPASSTASRSSG